MLRILLHLSAAAPGSVCWQLWELIAIRHAQAPTVLVLNAALLGCIASLACLFLLIVGSHPALAVHVAIALLLAIALLSMINW